ncbi:LytTR family two component transcriptional regulator [Keratinibaculum paraultunense]|uniref:LytTR family two component transcriptional regulator n=1 Tax=Keratinibaculum paraultunense TaxID=1278232 RepID=A0A4R3KQE0_9FIRM|nr:LytTR family DNA-binding domain-containing protein [Keratinibaculum paraultunense]QQY79647.1 response regulator transcription factor [Keratinibaculum paraultunense]TCS87069.1 LytTR family two component transcriptional regulator [Keratinibaculum paraultunense]
MQSILSAEAFHFEWLEDFSYDIILLDIQMAELSGIELAKLIREKDKHIQIIFVTAIPDYIGEGYDVDAINYLIKPISEEKLRECLSKAINKKEIQPKSILIEIDGGVHRIYEDSIMYLEIEGHELFIHQEDKTISIRKPLSEMEELLSMDEFIKPHRSYLVALKYIKYIDSKKITLKNRTTILISRGNSKEVQRKFFNYFKRDVK